MRRSKRRLYSITFHLVGASEQRARHGATERLGDL
jgi:hypothetical protein